MIIQESNLRKLAKFSFWFGCFLCVFLILVESKIFPWLLSWYVLLNDWGLLIFGICLLLAVPKFYFIMKDEEAKEGIYAYRIYTNGTRKAVWAFLSIGISCIVLFVLYRWLHAGRNELP